MILMRHFQLLPVSVVGNFVSRKGAKGIKKQRVAFASYFLCPALCGMKYILNLAATLVSCLLVTAIEAQTYNREKRCGTDTIHVNYHDIKYGRQVNYLAFQCKQAGKIGIRFDLGYASHSYNGNTKNWMGKHPGGVLGITVVHDKINIGVRFKVATLHPRSQLAFSGDTVVYDADINPAKIDFYAGYSFNLKYNFAIEPYAGVTRHLFNVIDEKDFNKTYNIPSMYGFHAGITLNKYFALKEFQFLSLFASFCYGFADFKKIHPSLGSGYSGWSLGLAYKVMAKRKFYDKIN